MLLLDTHALLWLVRGEFRTQAAQDAVEAAQDAGALYASAITAWELGMAELKRTGRPELGMAPSVWFRQALRATGARLATITSAIAAEAASDHPPLWWTPRVSSCGGGGADDDEEDATRVYDRVQA